MSDPEVESLYEGFCKKYPTIAKFFEKNKRAEEQFKECVNCRFLHIYNEDRLPYGKCTHKERPMMKVPCDKKKDKIRGEYLGIKIPELKK